VVEVRLLSSLERPGAVRGLPDEGVRLRFECVDERLAIDGDDGTGGSPFEMLLPP
jgi:hypothetical protein